jgi:hypothetical protein
MDIKCNLTKNVQYIPAGVENNLQGHYILALYQQAELQQAMPEDKKYIKTQ